MTWQGGKLQRESGPISEFARLKAFAKSRDDPGAALKSLAGALSKLPAAINLHVQLISGADGDAVEHWHVQGGKSAKALRQKPKKSDVVVIMRPETWMQIAQGQLAPYEALYTGKLRVGGDLEAAQALVKHLTDPAAEYRAPCR